MRRASLDSGANNFTRDEFDEDRLLESDDNASVRRSHPHRRWRRRLRQPILSGAVRL